MSVASTWYEIVLSPLIVLFVICLGAGLLWLARSKLSEFVSEVGLQKVSAFGVDLQFVEHQAVAAYAKQKLSPPSEDDRAAIREAVQFLAPLAAQTQILWVDDNPGGNQLERSTLLSWEVGVQAVRSTDDALRELEEPGQRFDLVISDWRRGDDSEDAPAGPELLMRMRELELPQRVLFYHGFVAPEALATRRRRALELGAVGATGSPGELFRWTLVELARVVLDHPSAVQRERRRHLAGPVAAAAGAAPRDRACSET